MAKRLAPIWIAALFVLPGCSRSVLESADVWDGVYGRGSKLTTAHYEIYTTVQERSILRRVPRLMESAYRGYNSQLPEPIETANKFKVYLFADRAQWVDFTKAFTGPRAELFCKIKAGAYCHNGACVAYNIDKNRTLSVLAHEGWHQFNSRHFEYQLPSWLDEGVAMLFEKPRRKKGGFHFESAQNEYRLNALAETLDKDRMIPLTELLAINPGEVLATDETESVAAFYSQSYALVRFLREADNGAMLADYRRLLLDGLEGDWALDKVSSEIARNRNIPRTILWNRIVGVGLFREYIGDDFERIEREYLAFCGRLVDQEGAD